MLLRTPRFANVSRSWITTGLLLMAVSGLPQRFGPRLWPDAARAIDGFTTAVHIGVIVFIVRGVRLRALERSK